MNRFLNLLGMSKVRAAKGPLASVHPVPINRTRKTGPLEYIGVDGETHSMIPSDKGGSAPAHYAAVDRAFSEMGLDYEGVSKTCAGCRVCGECVAHVKVERS